MRAQATQTAWAGVGDLTVTFDKFTEETELLIEMTCTILRQGHYGQLCSGSIKT